ncbi:transposase [Francisella halioticida]|nr:transposase [Francisella halioticida]
MLRKGDKMKYTKEFKDEAVKLCLQPDAIYYPNKSNNIFNYLVPI